MSVVSSSVISVRGKGDLSIGEAYNLYGDSDIFVNGLTKDYTKTRIKKLGISKVQSVVIDDVSTLVCCENNEWLTIDDCYSVIPKTTSELEVGDIIPVYCKVRLGSAITNQSVFFDYFMKEGFSYKLYNLLQHSSRIVKQMIVDVLLFDNRISSRYVEPNYRRYVLRFLQSMGYTVVRKNDGFYVEDNGLVIEYNDEKLPLRYFGYFPVTSISPLSQDFHEMYTVESCNTCCFNNILCGV